MKNVLIYGKRSYIGEHIKSYLLDTGRFIVDTVDARKLKPNEINYKNVDVVIDVVGIAHIKISDNMKKIFYSINRDLAISLCREAKTNGVKQFIYLSSMNVYGDTTEIITSRIQEHPKNFYGNSKLQADLAIQSMNDKGFKAVSIRPPVVYGKNCKGNFALLERLSRYMFIMPNYENHKSVIYIDNLCEFIKQIIDNSDRGVYHPQNREITSTLEIVIELRKSFGYSTYKISGVNWLIRLMFRFSHSLFKAFADDYYDTQLSSYRGNTYCVKTFVESIKELL